MFGEARCPNEIELPLSARSSALSDGRDLGPPTLITQVERQQFSDVHIVCRRKRVQAEDGRHSAVLLDVG